ncbi:hypothetical protein F5Y04DRAFT_45702 [Hypomontagnella monticulosa]|nr:hypothetical protein F5Y04DRAFT_45702 [Hypomontagnella monticulosa]
MATLEAAPVPDPDAFSEGLARCNSLTEKAKFITAHMQWDGIPGFMGTESHKGEGCSVSSPLFDDCTVVLLYGRMQLDEEEPIYAGTNSVARVQGGKTLTILGNSAAVWYPSACCWDVDDCHLALGGQCRRLGIGVVREPTERERRQAKREKRKGWWNKFFGRS